MGRLENVGKLGGTLNEVGKNGSWKKWKLENFWKSFFNFGEIACHPPTP
jgi:hypothetical protein